MAHKKKPPTTPPKGPFDAGKRPASAKIPLRDVVDTSIVHPAAAAAAKRRQSTDPKVRKKQIAKEKRIARALDQEETSYIPMGDKYEVTVEQYERAWELVSTQQALPQILAASRLTRRQLTYLTQNPLPGHETDCPSFAQRWVEIVHKARSRSHQAATMVAEGALGCLKLEIDNVKMSQRIVSLMLGDVGRHLVENQKLPESERKPVQTLMPGKTTTDMLLALRKFSDFGLVANAFRMVFDSPHQKMDPLSAMPKGAKIDFSSDTFAPAVTTLLADSSDSGDRGDLLDSLLPDFKDWSAEECERFIKTHERPDRDYIPSGTQKTDG